LIKVGIEIYLENENDAETKMSKRRNDTESALNTYRRIGKGYLITCNGKPITVDLEGATQPVWLIYASRWFAERCLEAHERHYREWGVGEEHRSKYEMVEMDIPGCRE
jgi:hypothetical protein